MIQNVYFSEIQQKKLSGFAAYNSILFCIRALDMPNFSALAHISATSHAWFPIIQQLKHTNLFMRALLNRNLVSGLSMYCSNFNV